MERADSKKITTTTATHSRIGFTNRRISCTPLFQLNQLAIL